MWSSAGICTIMIHHLKHEYASLSKHWSFLSSPQWQPLVQGSEIAKHTSDHKWRQSLALVTREAPAFLTRWLYLYFLSLQKILSQDWVLNSFLLPWLILKSGWRQQSWMQPHPKQHTPEAGQELTAPKFLLCWVHNLPWYLAQLGHCVFNNPSLLNTTLLIFHFPNHSCQTLLMCRKTHLNLDLLCQK